MCQYTSKRHERTDLNKTYFGRMLRVTGGPRQRPEWNDSLSNDDRVQDISTSSLLLRERSTRR